MAAKKKASKKSQKRTAKRAAEPTREDIKTVSLAKFLSDVKRCATVLAAEGASVGACLVTNPHTGQRFCVETDQTTCERVMRGRFIGGPCGLG